jgi:hypothetical protein
MASKGPSEGSYRRSSFQSSRPTTAPTAPAARSSAAVQAAPASPQPTRDQIAQRAQTLWQAKGCPAGQDEQNWLEAERQLRTEMCRH